MKYFMSIEFTNAGLDRICPGTAECDEVARTSYITVICIITTSCAHSELLSSG